MDKINYHGKSFRPVSSSSNAEVGEGTVFRYQQSGSTVWATYEGGSVRFGVLLASVGEDGILDMRYQQLNAQNEFTAGVCRSRPEILEDGRLRLHEDWKWTTGDCSSGQSVLEEILS